MFESGKHRFFVLAAPAGILAATLAVWPGCDEQPVVGTEPVNLLAGKKWQYSTDGGRSWSFDAPVIRRGQRARILARITFTAPDPAHFAVLEFTHGAPPRQRQIYYLNGRKIPLPLGGMFYKTIYAIPANMLRPGRNELRAKIGIDNRPPPDEPDADMPDVVLALATDLKALQRRHARIISGPVLGACGPDYWTVTCRTNMPAAVTLTATAVGERATTTAPAETTRLTSRPGLHHRFRVPRGPSASKVQYRLSVTGGGADFSTPAYTASFPPPEAGGPTRPLRIAVLGDSRTNRPDWSSVASAVLAGKPDLFVFAGDMVAAGRNNWQWQEHFFSASPALFATIPCYPVIGNHEENAPLYPLLFYTPSPGGLGLNWHQRIGPVLLIGIDGTGNWAPEGPNVKWLKRVLAGPGAAAKFVFFFSHYPAWTSGGHGKLNEVTGRPNEHAVRVAQDVIVPLLAKHRATAMFAGHDHFYERSELPGLTHIITGGAGAPLRGKSRSARQQNPYSRAFFSKLHYCLLEVRGDTCTMKVLTPEGEVIDTRTWKARRYHRLPRNDTHRGKQGPSMIRTGRRLALPPLRDSPRPQVTCCRPGRSGR